MLLTALISFFAAAGIFFLFQLAKKALPVKKTASENIQIYTLLAVRGRASELEGTVRELILRDEKCKILLGNCGMDEETAAIAEKLACKGDIEIIF